MLYDYEVPWGSSRPVASQRPITWREQTDNLPDCYASIEVACNVYFCELLAGHDGEHQTTLYWTNDS